MDPKEKSRVEKLILILSEEIETKGVKLSTTIRVCTIKTFHKNFKMLV